MGRPKKERENSTASEKKNDAEVVISQFRYKLDETQQEFIRKNYLKINDLLKLAQTCFDNPLIKEDSPEVDNVRKFVARVRNGNECFPFNSDEIQMILEHGELNSPIEICRIMFPDKETLVVESQTVAEILKAYKVENREDVKPLPTFDDQYVPPASDAKIIAKINVADMNAKLHINDLGADSRKKDRVTALKRTMHAPRFIAVASSHKPGLMRDLFETEFIRHTHDKPDLNAEEANQYISLCNEYVMSIGLDTQLRDLNEKLYQAMDNPASKKEYNRDISETRKAIADEYHKCQDRIKKLHNDLNISRSKRKAIEGAANESLAKWIDLVKTQEGREKMRRLQEARNLQIEGEIKRISDFDQLIAEFAGLSIAEIIKF